MDVRQHGTIRKVVNKTAAENNGKPSAFGFIRGTDGKDYFFLPSHLQVTQQTTWDDVVAGFKAGQVANVEFEPVAHEKGDRAIGVKVLP